MTTFDARIWRATIHTAARLREENWISAIPGITRTARVRFSAESRPPDQRDL